MKYRKRWVILSCLAVLATLSLISLIPRQITIVPLEAHASTISTNETTTTVKQYVEAQAKLLGVNPIDADWIISHESQYLDRSGDDGNSRGYWQISSIWHPEVSSKCAYNLQCSTRWALNWILKGNINQWATWKYRCDPQDVNFPVAMYKNAPNCQ